MELEIIHRIPDSPGDRPPLLFVHGAYSGAWIWDAHFLPYFAEHGYPAHAVSLRGHGGSEGGEQLHFWGIDDYVRDVRSAVRRMDRRPILVGHSLGGLLCQRFLADGGEAAGLVLMNSVPPHGMAGSLGRLLSDGPMLAGKLGTMHLFPQSMWDHVFSAEELAELFLSPFTDPDHVSWMLPLMQMESARVAAELAVFCRISSERIRCPVAVVGGQNDRIVPAEEIQETAAAFGVEPSILPKLGHTVMVEDHWRDAADAVREWVERR